MRISPEVPSVLASTAARALLVVVVVAAGLAVQAASAGPADADDGTVFFEGDHDVHNLPVELAIAYLSDCEGTQTAPRCGSPPARWAAAARPLQVCTFQANRPVWLSAEQFREVVANSAAIWNRADAAIGVRYTGDCAVGTRWATGNLRQEIGFDDERDAVKGSSVAVTLANTSWSPSVAPTTRSIVEADIIIDPQFANIPVCFATTIVHEMGHALGFAHSDDVADVMYPSFNAANTATCKQLPSAEETARLQELYGVNRSPVVNVTPTIAGTAGQTVTLSATATDAENDVLTYQWVQVAGAAVALSSGGDATATFVMPPGADPMQFRVTTADPYLHSSSANVTVTAQSAGPPAAPTSPATATTTANITGSIPPSGFGLIVFSGGTSQQLVAASGCPAATAAYWSTDMNGGFVVYVPGTSVATVNAVWNAQFGVGIPANTPLIGRCRT